MFFVEDIKNGEGKYIFLWWRRKPDKEREENIWRRKIYFFWRRRKAEKEKERKYLEEENIWRRKIFDDGKYIFCQGEYFVFWLYLRYL